MFMLTTSYYCDVIMLQRCVIGRVIKTKRIARDEEKEKRKEVRARRKMDTLAKKLGKWDPRTIIRKFRDNNLKSDS